MKKKKPEIFTASNGVTVEYAPDAKAGKPLTDAEWKKMKRVDVNKILTKAEQQAMSEFMVKRMRGRPRKKNPKINTTLRIDSDILARLRATGQGWQTRAGEGLRHLLDEGRI